MKKECCYVVIYDDFPGIGADWSNSRWYTSIEAIYHNEQAAIDSLIERADAVIADANDNEGRIKIVYNGLCERWPYLFTWEENDRQLTYKIVPYQFED